MNEEKNLEDLAKEQGIDPKTQRQEIQKAAQELQVTTWLEAVKKVHQTQNWGSGDVGLWTMSRDLRMKIIYPDGDECAECYTAPLRDWTR